MTEQTDEYTVDDGYSMIAFDSHDSGEPLLLIHCIGLDTATIATPFDIALLGRGCRKPLRARPQGPKRG